MLPVPKMLTCAMECSSGWDRKYYLTFQVKLYRMKVVDTSICRDDVPMDTTWLSDEEMAAWLRLVATMELLPGALESQLRRDADLTHFEYFCLATLSESPEQTLRMTALAQQTRATLPRLS